MSRHTDEPNFASKEVEHHIFTTEFEIPVGVDAVKAYGLLMEGVQSRDRQSEIIKSAKKVFQKARVKEGMEKYGLTEDQTMAIILYTIEDPFKEKSLYWVLNGLLSKRPDKKHVDHIKPFLAFFLSALAKLPNHPGDIVYRGVNLLLLDKPNSYVQNNGKVWIQFNSTSTSKEVADNFGRDGNCTRFIIRTKGQVGKDISAFSFFPEESEVLLPPNCRFKVEQFQRVKSGDKYCDEITLEFISAAKNTEFSVSPAFNMEKATPVAILSTVATVAATSAVGVAASTTTVVAPAYFGGSVLFALGLVPGVAVMSWAIVPMAITAGVFGGGTLVVSFLSGLESGKKL